MCYLMNFYKFIGNKTSRDTIWYIFMYEFYRISMFYNYKQLKNMVIQTKNKNSKRNKYTKIDSHDPDFKK